MKYSLPNLMKKYKITREVLYSRLNYLGIEPRKENNKLFLNDIDVSELDALDKYIKQNGTMQGYLVPEKTEIVDTSEAIEAPIEDKLQASESAITTTSGSGALLDLDSEITEAEAEMIEQSEESEYELIDKKAQYDALGRYIASKSLVDHYFNTLDFNDPDVCQQYEEFEKQRRQQQEQNIAKINPKKLTQLLVSKAKAKTKAKVIG